MKTVSLPDFLGFLTDQSPKDFQGEGVTKFLKAHELEEDALLPFIYFREETYGRNLVYKNEHFELLVLTWLPQQRTPIHDHAGQRCWMWLQAGTLTFKNFDPIENDNSPLKVCGSCETHTAGESAYIDDGIGIHAISNSIMKPAISLHLYAAPIPRCRIYDECSKVFKWVDLQYFTTPDFNLNLPQSAPVSI